MREIKFRAWTGMGMEYRIVVGQLGAFYASGIDPKDTACIETTTIYSKETPIMQFTGLKDKNGKEIYEGDIMAMEHSDLPGWRGVVEFGPDESNGYSKFYVKKFLWRMQATEVIGNIYENPDLLGDAVEGTTQAE